MALRLSEEEREKVIALLALEVSEREGRERGQGLGSSGSKHREAIAESLRMKLISGSGTLTIEERELLDHYLYDLGGK